MLVSTVQDIWTTEVGANKANHVVRRFHYKTNITLVNLLLTPDILHKSQQSKVRGVGEFVEVKRPPKLKYLRYEAWRANQYKNYLLKRVS